MKLHKIKEILNDIAPLDLQDEWDNSGMQVSCGHKDVKKILIALEITDEVIDEALDLKADLILTHHPMLFNPIKSICPFDVVGEYIIRLIKNDIAVYACHTPFDKIKGGNNDYFLKLLGVKNIKAINDYVRIATLPKETKLESVAKKVAKVAGAEGMIRVTGDKNMKVKTVGICTGAGADMFMDAFVEGADVYITGDIKHHQAQVAREIGCALIDGLHAGTEKQFVDNMYDMLSKKLDKDVKLIKSKVDQNPFDFSV